MPGSKSKTLSALFRSANKLAKQWKSGVPSTSAQDIALKQYVSSIKSTSNVSSKPLSEIAAESLNFNDSGKSAKLLTREISSILCGDLDSYLSDSETSSNGSCLENVLDVPWLSNVEKNNASLRRKEIARERKEKWTFKSSQTSRFHQLVKQCACKLGTETAIKVFVKLGRETGLKEYNALIRLCIEKARETNDEEMSLKQLSKAYQLLKSMKEQGFQVEEESYGPILMYFIDFGMVQEFDFYCELIIDRNADSLARLAYYEMLLWSKVEDEDKIEELLYHLSLYDDGDKSAFQENYLLALCERDRVEDFVRLLRTVDITKISSTDCVTNIFKFLGKLLLKSFAKKFLQELVTRDIGAEDISKFIYNYTTSMPNLAVEDVILEFKNLHAELELRPISSQYQKLIMYCCELFKVHAALDMVDQMFEAGLTLPLETFNSILEACDKSCEYNLVHRIYSMILHHDITPNSETFRIMINMTVRTKDFEGAYGMLKDLEKFNVRPTTNMYNAIMAGYFREKDTHAALKVLKHMEDANVKSDSQTFSYLISNCTSGDDISKFLDEMKDSGVQHTKHVYMSLINGYAASGQFEKAKQVIYDRRVPVKGFNEIRSVLVSALASHGQISDALKIYEEMKEAQCKLEPKAIICLIENLQSEGDLRRLLHLLEQLNGLDHWVDAAYRVITYCIRKDHFRSIVDLLKKLVDAYKYDEVAKEVLFDEVFCQIAEKDPINLQLGLDLLQAIKKEIGLLPSRQSLDFLLSACVNAKDLQACYLIWKEYKIAGLPYNILSYVRMYRALLALGDYKSAANILNKIPRDDIHVCSVVQACQEAYGMSASTKGKQKKKKIRKDVRCEI
ncbi:pentatricopeptide repeat-containing protein At4g04790, mitochondrial-like [Lycium ferocissimum]|uniref:pentatricopeptide repeat-containing protein At4g04790, mitochondrial-like n=1 Tax=Lycium ferocissimum TaxID=112874 RepID=UPI0028161EAB|nr:pentatricopeptide repeat-containing protein At4g04790, mitochondrial-like [Lycium ferocissimum]